MNESDRQFKEDIISRLQAFQRELCEESKEFNDQFADLHRYLRETDQLDQLKKELAKLRPMKTFEESVRDLSADLEAMFKRN